MSAKSRPKKPVQKEKITPAVKLAVKAFKRGSKKKTSFVEDSLQEDAAVIESQIENVSPTEVEKKEEEPTIIRLAKKFGTIGAGTVGGIIGSRFGFGSQGAALGYKYGSQLAEYGAKKLITQLPILGSFKKGGTIPKTGAYILHKGEKVVPVKKYRRSKY